MPLADEPRDVAGGLEPVGDEITLHGPLVHTGLDGVLREEYLEIVEQCGSDFEIFRDLVGSDVAGGESGE